MIQQFYKTLLAGLLPIAKQIVWPARLVKGAITGWIPVLLLLTALVGSTVQASGQTSSCTTPSFEYAISFDAADRPFSVTTGDFNLDGRLDMATANRNTNNVSVLLGNGTGGFTAAVNFGTGSGPISVTTADFNKDGKLDLATANNGSSNVSLLLGNGSGGFAAATNFSVGTYPNSIKTGDFNGDGRPDLAFSNLGNNISVLLGNGAGSFAAPVNSFAGGGPSSVTTGDFNRDGRLDVATSNGNTDNVSLLLGNGAGGFAAPVNFVTGDSPDAITSGDFNGDGKTDIATANYRASNLSVLLGNGAGSFAAAVSFTASTDPNSITTGDFNGDGKADLATGSSFDYSLAVLLGNGTGGFAAQVSFYAGDISGITTGDFNGDTRLDLASANGGDDNVSVLLNTCSGTCPVGRFAAGTNFNVGSSPRSVTVSDFNKDGKPDMATANYANNNVSVLLGNGAGGFAAAANFGAGTNPRSVITDDFNRDGNADIAIANYTSNNVSVLLGNGTGGFAAAVNFNAGTNPSSIITGDFNRDGRADIATANYTSNNMSVLLGNGAGGFAAAANFGAGANPSSIITGDFNRDGRADIATANYSSNSVSLLLGNGIGGFSAAVNFGTGTNPFSITTGDFNGDGKADIAAANYISNNVSVLLGNGAGGFAAGVNFGAGTNPSSITTGDFNRDGKADMATANYTSNNVSVLFGNGAGGFATAVNFGAGTNSSSITTGDFNGDSKPDLAAANSNSGNVSVSLNICGIVKPVITAGGPVTFCAGGNVVLNAPAGYTIYQWSNGATTRSITVSQTGSFTVVVGTGDGFNSPASDPVAVTVNPLPTTPTVSIVQPTCTVTTGTITVNSPIAAGTTYSINGTTYQAATTFTNLAPGSYNVRAKNSNGCVSAPTPITIVAKAPVISTVSATQPTVAVPTGTIVVNASGTGTLGYSIDNGTNWQSSATFNGVAPGSYTIKVRLQAETACVTTYANNPVVINPVPAPLLVPARTTISAEGCSPGNGAIDPGETVTVSFCIQNYGNAATTNLVGTLQNTGGVSNASGPQTYGAVQTNATLACQSFTFTANGTCGSTITATINLQDGTTNRGTVSYTLNLGVITQNPFVAYTNSAPITINDVGASSLYPSNITVSGINNPVTKVTVSLNGFGHTWPDDVNVLLVSPTGKKIMLMANAGAPDIDVTNAKVVFDDAASTTIPTTTAIPSNVTSVYLPTDNDQDGYYTMPVPAPARPYTTTLSALNGLNPNGTWSLYVADDYTTEAGSITGGWTLNIKTVTNSCCVVTSPPPTVTAPTVTQPSCALSTGAIVVNATGSGTLEYSINNGTSYQLSNTFSGLAAGSYNIRVRQQTNPASSTTYSANPVVINAAPAVPATPTVTVTQPTCTMASGSITITNPGGAGFTYSINGTTYQASNVFNNVAPGSYNVTARNSNCTSAATPVTINAAPATAPAAPTVNVTQPTCAAPTGTITVTAPAGSGITYSINGTAYQSGTTFSNVSPGSYNVTARNSGGCISPATPVTVTAQATDTEPPFIPSSLTVFLNASGQASVTSASVAPLITDNCAVDPNSITVSANSFSCANVSGGAPHQPFTANSSVGNQNASGEQGMDFRVNVTNGIVITQLGAFDHQANGIIGTQSDGDGNLGIRVAIFNKATQSIVSGLDAVITGNGDAFSGNYRYKNIAPVTLPPGDYLVLAKGYNANELSGNSYLGGGTYPQGDNASGAISYLNTVYYDENDAVPGFTFPATSVNTGTSSVLKSGTFTYALPQSNTVTISAKDVSGNQSQVVATVTVVDTVYVLTTKDITVNLNSSGQASIQPQDVLQSLKNNCGIDVTNSTLQVSPSSFNCSNVGASTFSSPYQPFIANSITGNQNAAGEQGMDFRVNDADGIVITQLGAFDHQANGLVGTQSDGNGNLGIRVAIFSKATQMIVPGLDVVITGNGDAFSGNYRYKNITAVTLPPGDYVVLAKGYNASELSGNSYLGGGGYPQGDNAGGAISYLNTVFYDENDAVPGFTYPTVSFNTGMSSVLKSGTFTYKTKMTAGTQVTLTATDVYGHQKRATATVTVTDFNQVCTPAPIAAAKAAPVMAAAVSPAQQPAAQSEQPKLGVYPNPSKGAFNVQLSGFSGSRMSIEIADGNGKVVAVKAVTPNSKTQMLTVPFDLGNQATGIYWIKAVSATGVQTTKVLLQR